MVFLSISAFSGMSKLAGCCIMVMVDLHGWLSAGWAFGNILDVFMSSSLM